MNKPKLIQTFLPDGTLEGVRIIEIPDSPIKAFVAPRIKINDLKSREEINWPALYILVNSADDQIYIGESEKFFHRIKNHEQTKDYWDTVIAIVSNTNSLEKSDVKYLESLAVEKAKHTAAMEVLNKTVPTRNNVHEFKVHTLEAILEDTGLVMELLGYSIFAPQQPQKSSNRWYLSAKKTSAIAEYRANKLVILAGSKIDPTYSDRWARKFATRFAERTRILEDSAELINGVYILNQNVQFNSPSQASGFATGRNSNGWTEWKTIDGKTMDEVIRKESV